MDRASALVLSGAVAIFAVVVLLCLLGDDWYGEAEERRSSEASVDPVRTIPITLSWASDAAPSAWLDPATPCAVELTGDG